MLADLHQHAIMHLGFLIGAAALLLRNQLHLRTALLVSIALNITYHAFSQNGPMWDDLFWNVVTLSTNLTVLVQLVLDRTHIGLSAEEEQLFQAFGSLTPGEFRKLVRKASWQTADAATVLTEENVKPTCLFYVLEGSMLLEKAGRQTVMPAPVFIGEVAFVKTGTRRRQ